jgi:hypothetical protein
LQSQLAQLSAEDLQQLQPYLQLQQVLTGFDQLLQLCVGLSLQPRAAAAGETWNSNVLVYELWEMPDSSQQQQQQQGVGVKDTGTLARSCTAAAGSESAHRCSGKLLGTVYLDPFGGFSTQLLLYGPLYTGSLQQQQQQQQQYDSQDSASSRSSSSQNTTVPAVAVGLQSQGFLDETHTQLALGLWELCHELGHAVNFILSAAGNSPSINLQQQQQQQQSARLHARLAGLKAGDKASKPYHMHAAWLPLEVLELPSTLFEAISMDAACLQVLCRHSSSGQQLPGDLAVKVARFIRSSHYNPLLMQQMVRRAGLGLCITSCRSTGFQTCACCCAACLPKLVVTWGDTSMSY